MPPKHRMAGGHSRALIEDPKMQRFDDCDLAQGETARCVHIGCWNPLCMPTNSIISPDHKQKSTKTRCTTCHHLLRRHPHLPITHYTGSYPEQSSLETGSQYPPPLCANITQARFSKSAETPVAVLGQGRATHTTEQTLQTKPKPFPQNTKSFALRPAHAAQHQRSRHYSYTHTLTPKTTTPTACTTPQTTFPYDCSRKNHGRKKCGEAESQCLDKGVLAQRAGGGVVGTRPQYLGGGGGLPVVQRVHCVPNGVPHVPGSRRVKPVSKLWGCMTGPPSGNKTKHRPRGPGMPPTDLQLLFVYRRPIPRLC